MSEHINVSVVEVLTMSMFRILVCASLFVIGCDRTSGAGGSDLASQIEKVRKELTLVPTTGARTAHMNAKLLDAKLRVSISPHGVLMEDRTGETPALVFVPTKMLETPDALVPSLLEPLQAAQGRSLANAWALAIDGRVPYSLVHKVVSHAHQAKLSAPWLVFSDKKDERYVQLSIPTTCDAPEGADAQAQATTCEICPHILKPENQDTCARPLIRWVEGGVQVEATSSRRGRGACVKAQAVAARDSAATTWHDAVVKTAACPGALDGVEGVLDALDEHAALCDVGELVPTQTATWEQVGGLVAGLVSSSTLSHVILGSGEATKPGCQGAFLLGTAR